MVSNHHLREACAPSCNSYRRVSQRYDDPTDIDSSTIDSFNKVSQYSWPSRKLWYEKHYSVYLRVIFFLYSINIVILVRIILYPASDAALSAPIIIWMGIIFVLYHYATRIYVCACSYVYSTRNYLVWRYTYICNSREINNGKREPEVIRYDRTRVCVSMAWSAWDTRGGFIFMYFSISPCMFLAQ